jgi:hypothetical protein
MNMAMRNRRTKITRGSQSGFALMMVMFMATVLLISVMVATPYIRTERQREKEEEMIWRGKQYVRGIKLYYRKTGRFPTSVDDLTKPKLGSIRFMRQAYKDPMNKPEGSWRMIYVGPAGQLIGSLKPPQTLQMPGRPGTPIGANTQQPTSFGASGFGQSPPAQAGSQPGQPGTTQSGSAAQGGNANAANPSTDAVSADAGIDASSATGLGSADSPVIGGNIIGVGSKINRRSVIVYDKAKNYRLFEFIWNPSKEVANAINQQAGAPAQNPQGAPKGQTGFGFGQQNNAPGANPSANPPANTPTEMPMPTPPPDPNPVPPQP